jgi:hypothetical protein
MFSITWKRVDGRVAGRTPKRARPGYRLLAELLEDRTVLSSVRGMADVSGGPPQIGSVGLVQQTFNTQQMTFVQSKGGTGIHPSGPGYPLPPVLGPALRGDLVAPAATASVPLPSQQAAASLLPVLLVGEGLAAPAASLDVAATTSLLAPQGLASRAPVVNTLAAAPTSPGTEATGLTQAVADARTSVPFTAVAYVTPSALTAALAPRVTVTNPPAQGFATAVDHTEGLRALESAGFAPRSSADRGRLDLITPFVLGETVASLGGGVGWAAPEQTVAGPAAVTVLDVLVPSTPAKDTPDVGQASHTGMAAEVTVVIASPAPVAEPGATVTDGGQLLTTSAATPVVPGAVLERLFADQGDRGEPTTWGGFRLVVPLLLAAGAYLATRRRAEDSAEPVVRLRKVPGTV